MQSRARLLSHPIHQILIVFPLGLLTTSVVFDGIGLTTHTRLWSYMATYMIAAGLLGGLAAALFGFVDYLGIPAQTRARRVARLHGLTSLFVLVLFGAGEFLRLGSKATPSVYALALSLTGALVAGLAGWLGGELVTRMAIGVDDDAGLDAASSLDAARTTHNTLDSDVTPTTYS